MLNTPQNLAARFSQDANGRIRRAHTREIKGIDQNTSLNRALWTLTAEMANIKTGSPTIMQSVTQKLAA